MLRSLSTLTNGSNTYTEAVCALNWTNVMSEILVQILQNYYWVSLRTWQNYTGSANWILYMTNTWWHRRTKGTTEIDKFPLKLDKWSEKLQGSRYEQNNEIAVTQNDEKLIITLKSLSNWPSKSQYILCILKNQQNPMNGVENSKSQNTWKTIQAQPTEFPA